MKELTDDQLDGLFRKSAEELNPSVDPAAWPDMQSRLDAHDLSTSGKIPLRDRLIRWGLPLLIFLLFTGSGWYLSQKIRATEEPVLKTKPLVLTKPEKPQMVVGNVLKTQRQQKRSAGNKVATPTPETTPVQPEMEIISAKKPALIRLETNVATQPAGQSLLYSALTAGRKQTKKQAMHSKHVKEGTLSFIADNDEQKANPFPAIHAGGLPSATERRLHSLNPDYALPVFERMLAEKPAPATEPISSGESIQLTQLAIRPAHWSTSLPFTSREVLPIRPDDVATDDTPRQPASLSLPNQRGLSARFMASPDLSAVGLRNFARPGTNLGLMLEYRLAPRWSVQTGALWSTKVYNAKPSDYGSTGSIQWLVVPESVDGRCRMLDIPLNMRYDVLSHNRPDSRLPDRWFVSGGITMYYILREDYVYNYAWPNDPNIEYRDWSTSTGRNGVSQLNLSTGYERTLNRRLSWQIEPFVKVPLKGVGVYKINLLSTGVFFSLRYKL